MAHLLLRLALLLLSATLCFSQVPAGPCVQYFNPPGAISVTGTWSIQTNILSDDCVPIHIAGMRGIFPGNNTQVPIVNAPGGLRPRILQAFENMLFEAASQGAGPADCAEVIVYVSDMVSIRPLVNSVQAQLWNPTGLNASVQLVYPPRTILQIDAFNGLTCEDPLSNTYYQGTPGPNGQVQCVNATDIPIGDILEVKGVFYVMHASAMQITCTCIVLIFAALSLMF